MFGILTYALVWNPEFLKDHHDLPWVGAAMSWEVGSRQLLTSRDSIRHEL